ncbi:acyltransferase [Mycolicibacterium flavescens]|uniref:Acyltransferase n=2 Tax=Mycolicibacterium flavescens TaxID=1776 RepID=A0A1E3RL20_MYCFV|nr:acyltransferase [Mycolicibacterium flavescens]ODQ90573.1 acyltransferase [Mycolicibacterium flavescens]
MRTAGSQATDQEVGAAGRAPGAPVTSPGQRNPEKQFRPDIEGLRAVAVLAVVLFHADVPGLGGGFVGVDVFFVISGFLITGLLWREASATGTVSLRSFFGARARRLLPASAAVGVVTMIASALLLPPLQVRSVTMDGITSALYVSNYWFISSGVKYFGHQSLLSPSPFQHYWSLGVEEQFYLVWPLLIIGTAWLIRRVRRQTTRTGATSSVRPYLLILTLVVVVSFALSLVLTYLIPPIAFFSLPTRAWQLAAGGLIALTVGYWRRLPTRSAVPLGWVGLALILLACTQLNGTTSYPGIAALLPTLGVVLVIGAGCAGPSHGCGRILASSPMGAIGRVSYSWYLWHWPVLVLTPAFLGHQVGLPTKLVAVLVSLGLAVLTLRFIENPLRFADRVRRSPLVSLGLGATATAVAVCVGLLLLLWTPNPVGNGPAAEPMTITAEPVAPGSPAEAYDAAVRDVFAQVQAQVAASAYSEAVPSNLDPPLTDQASQQFGILTNGCLRVLPFDSSHPECAAGDVTSETTVALIGDSRAAMFNPAFQKIAEQRQWRLLMMAKAGCPITDLRVNQYFNTLAEEFQRCAEWRTEIMARLRAERPQLVVISSSRAYDANGAHTMVPGLKMYDNAWIGSLTELVQQLRDTGAKVLVLGPTPDPPAPIPLCLSAHLDDAAACADVRDAKHAAGITAETAATEAGGGRYADITELLCTANRCPPIVGNTMVYFDAGHLTREYSQLLAPALGALADRALAER